MSNNTAPTKFQMSRNEFQGAAAWIGGFNVKFLDSAGRQLTDGQAVQAFGRWDPVLAQKLDAMFQAMAAVREHVVSKFEPRQDASPALKLSI